ncbi:FlgN protein [Anaerobranca californiensis DSM 14826]|jgi:flagellar biosynthesis/type III secretory pathway chaperone|uniref:FlgN protein n=1 Tax=Anaerobranca californiensis DSM 14826 TaxID=1120989 RepID=A0A1M6Q1W1_9FIRM|nr:flagellar protein FlgN [Anaerobranca californiensis]SHK14228.1 FlgN protein [Anaerobranca californiensis DSM 14826]
MREIYIKKMAENLKEQTKGYKELLKYSEEKRAALVLAKMEALDSIIQQEEELIKKLGAFELERLEIQKNLANALNIPHEDLRWENLKNILKKEEQQHLQGITEELRKVIEKIADVNALNKKLLDQSLKMVQLSLNTIAGEEEKIYSKTPKPKGKGGSFLDIKA